MNDRLPQAGIARPVGFRRKFPPGSRALRIALFLMVAVAGHGFAGGGPQNVLVVVNDQSQDSLAIGNHYRKKRDIPEGNVCHLSVDPSAESVSFGQFEDFIRKPIDQYIRDAGLTNQIDYVVFCKDFPTRINGVEAITAAMGYGFKKAPPSPPCKVPPETKNNYAFVERAFSHRDTYGGKQGYLAMFLAAHDLDDAMAMVDRALAADGTRPRGTFYFLKPPGDPDRNIRYKSYGAFDFQARFFSGFPARVFAPIDWIADKPDVMGYMTGVATVFAENRGVTNRYLPGAMADHFTSFGGRIPTNELGQSTVLDWIRAGATVSYGTVAEPCSFLEKFPNPMAFFWYARGFNAAESYWMSVINPYQGLFVGDPLTAPYADRPSVSFPGIRDGEVVSGVVTVSVSAVASSPERPCMAIDVYVDNVFVSTVTNVGPSAWNMIKLEVDGTACSYMVDTGDDLYTMVSRLADTANYSLPHFQAAPLGDRLMLFDKRVNRPGRLTPYSLEADAGIAPALTVGGKALTSSFLDGTEPALKTLAMKGTAGEGDQVILLVRPEAGAAVTSVVIAAEGEQAYALAKRLADGINENAALQATGGVRVANLKGGGAIGQFSLLSRAEGADGLKVSIDYQAKTGPGKSDLIVSTYAGQLTENVPVIAPRGMLLFWCGREKLAGEFTWDTRDLPDGVHTILAVVRDGTAVQNQGSARVAAVVRNSGLSCELEGLQDGQVIPAGTAVELTVEVHGATSPVVRAELFAQEKRVAEADKAPFRFTWDSGSFGAGTIGLRCRVEDAAGKRALSPPLAVTVTRAGL